MRIVKHLLLLTAASVMWWVAFWKWMGQDLNAFAREVLPMPIGICLAGTIAVAGLILLIGRIGWKRWPMYWPKVLWTAWIVCTIGFTYLLFGSNG